MKVRFNKNSVSMDYGTFDALTNMAGALLGIIEYEKEYGAFFTNENIACVHVGDIRKVATSDIFDKETIDNLLKQCEDSESNND